MKNTFETNGFCIVKNAFSQTLLDELAKSLKNILKREETNVSLDQLILDREVENHQIVYNASATVGSSAAAYRLLGNSEIISILEAISGISAHRIHIMPMHVQIQCPSDERFDYKWHQESSFYPMYPDVLSVWFPLLRPSSCLTGTMAVIPGSHKKGKRDANMYFSHEKFRQIEPVVEDYEENYQIVIEINPGDVCIFHPDLVHKSLGNQGRLPRLTGIVRAIDIGLQRERRPIYKAISYEIS